MRSPYRTAHYQSSAEPCQCPNGLPFPPASRYKYRGSGLQQGLLHQAQIFVWPLAHPYRLDAYARSDTKLLEVLRHVIFVQILQTTHEACLQVEARVQRTSTTLDGLVYFQREALLKYPDNAELAARPCHCQSLKFRV